MIRGVYGYFSYRCLFLHGVGLGIVRDKNCRKCFYGFMYLEASFFSFASDGVVRIPKLKWC